MMDPAVFYPYNEQDEENANGDQGGVPAGTPGAQYAERIQVENGED